ncbi:5-dehydro-4-deoxy-D-glucuronate isomerase [Membranihabitans maritimus]|uniref:5-dehydro-4-deoxy-D-glucuronate isomerase n=1 Tax=Membranihabitans maritimus TaxID=2904244 RepID=UPI001F000C2C|nr:5-dehydro-4-deoxy-D-glucuronate isomerase [Membranihabitans maritimus]
MSFSTRYARSPEEIKNMDTEELRKHFLITNVFDVDRINWTYSHFDRFMTGGIIPTTDVGLDTIPPLRSEYFLERRELGVINIGEPGSVLVDGEEFELGYKEALYVGQGAQAVIFKSKKPDNPAKFYLNSAPAHKSHPTIKVTEYEAELVTLGSPDTSNHRTIRKLLVNSVVKTCQLQMGMTELKNGSVWNTMPAHVHDRRMEVYLYFELLEDQSVSHFMGEPSETRHIWMQNEQAVISPPWSIHAGAGTSNYTFIWGMAGENLDYGDMDKVSINQLR